MDTEQPVVDIFGDGGLRGDRFFAGGIRFLLDSLYGWLLAGESLDGVGG